MFRFSAKTVVILAALCFLGLIILQVAWTRSAYNGEVALYTKAKKQFELELQTEMGKNERLKASLKDLLDHYNERRQLSKLQVDWFNSGFTQAIDSSLSKKQFDVNVRAASIVKHRHKDSAETGSDIIVSNSTRAPDPTQIKDAGKLCVHCILGLNESSHEQYNYQILLFYKEQWPAVFAKLWYLILASLLLLISLGFLFREIIRKYKQEKKISESKNDFINNLTHEMQTPVFAIQVANRLVKEKTRELPEIIPFTKIIDTETQQLKRHAGRILDLASIDGGQVELSYERVELNSFIEQKRPTIELLLQASGGKLNLDLHAGPLYVNLDPVHFNNVLVSLSDNAIKYNLNVPLLIIETGEEGNRFYLKISDNGTGIKKEFLPYVMDKFYRVPHVKRNGIPGFGLGLSYVKQIVDLHKGGIKLTSVENKGTSVTISLPKATGHA